jgi:tRNA dimethylallyltransferase
MIRDSADSRPPVVVVTGPTAAGKTPLAIAIAQQFGGEIVNADSMQVYRYLDIGTAKPTPEQRAQVPHHLLDLVKPDVSYNAARYLADARAAAERIHARGRLVVLTGGTGLYIRVFLEGVVAGAAPDPELRAALQDEHRRAVEAGEPERLHRRLADVDPDAAERIHPNDLRRVIRALEISQRGVVASQRRREHGFGDRPYRVLHLAIDPGREPLNARIDRRCREMIEAGLLQEVRGLRGRGYGPELPSLQSIGYRHLAAVVDGSDTLANALVAMQRDTRRFARRQRTWLRRVPEAIWIDPAESDQIFRHVEDFLARTTHE